MDVPFNDLGGQVNYVPFNDMGWGGGRLWMFHLMIWGQVMDVPFNDMGTGYGCSI